MEENETSIVEHSIISTTGVPSAELTPTVGQKGLHKQASLLAAWQSVECSAASAAAGCFEGRWKPKVWLPRVSITGCRKTLPTP